MQADSSPAFNNPKEEYTSVPSKRPLKKELDHIPHTKKKEDDLSTRIKHISSTYKTEENSNKKLREKLEITTQEIIILFYQMEQSIFTNGLIPEEMYIRLEALRELNAVYKRALDEPSPSKITLPLEFVEEYSALIRRTEHIMNEITKHIERFSSVDGAEFYIRESVIRLDKLTILCSHYKNALELD